MSHTARSPPGLDVSAAFVLAALRQSRYSCATVRSCAALLPDIAAHQRRYPPDCAVLAETGLAGECGRAVSKSSDIC